jgi:hypothetical protein
MISRQWRGVANAEKADAYIAHLHAETFPAIRKLPDSSAHRFFVARYPKGWSFSSSRTGRRDRVVHHYEFVT